MSDGRLDASWDAVAEAMGISSFLGQSRTSSSCYSGGEEPTAEIERETQLENFSGVNSADGCL